ncbi:hypothetical protein AGDE_13175 [Angomonas deanei]|uniref:Uncharacterized protein n=1 Tax=Angomonas deanei TaxID=59799 RepID=A0A7G2CPI5_9TRYP|nr:hypothetical protein AGDE_13175 [Angomonas deanei]CAD2221415.1 hypothetical protein, conserved [Angomonas deanei]|eukprot:EPY22580.1 hypothetical protein AGDE_13175 [Angomonas deanei]
MGDYFYGMGLLPEDDSPVAYTDRTPSQRETPLVNHISVSDPRHTRRQSTEQPYSSPMRCSSGHIEIKPPKYNSFPQTSRLSNSPAVTSPLTTLKSPAFAERRKSDERKDTKGKKPTTSNNFYNYDFGFDALGIPTEQFRDHRSGSAGDQKLPPLSKAESGHRLASASDADNRKRDVHLPPISLSKKEANLSRMDSLGTRTITSTILARQLPMAGELASSGSFDRVDDASSIRPLKNPLYGYSDPSSSSSVSSGTDSSDEDAEEIPLVTSMTQIIPKSPKKLMNLLARYSCYGINPPSADSPQDDFVRDLFSSRYNTKYDVHSEWSNSLSSVGISAVSSPDFKQLGDVAPGVTGWIGPPPRGSMEHIMEHAGGDQFAREADMDTWETVDGLVVIDHDGKQPSSSAAVTNDNRRILVAGGLGGGTGYDTDECVFRQKGCTALPSALLSESRKRFCRNGESVFTVYVDRSEAGKRTNMPVTPVRNIGCSVVKECLQYNAEFKEITSDLKLSLIYYIEGGEYIDLISRSTKDTEIRQLDVAQSPIFGPCVDNCQWLLLETIDDFSELLNRCEEPVDPKLSGILVAQFLFQSFLPPPEGSRHKIGDVVMSSFSLACTSSPKTLTPILEQRPGSQWRLFKYALCKGPCIVLSCINICENDQDAADSLRILQKMKSIPHPRPRRGSVADYITRQREEVANLEWRKGFGKTENKTMDVALNKAKASIEDAVTFIKDPLNVHIPLYVDAKRRGSSFFLGRRQ